MNVKIPIPLITKAAVAGGVELVGIDWKEARETEFNSVEVLGPGRFI